MKKMKDLIKFLKDSNAREVILQSGKVTVDEIENNFKAHGVLDKVIEDCQFTIVW